MNCPFCMKSNDSGLLLCAYCGMPLPSMASNRLSATSKYVTQELRLRTSGTGPLNQAALGQLGPRDTGFLHESAVLTLDLLDANRKIYLKTQGHISLGRADKNSDWQPTVDLAPYGGVEMGVSRAHVDLLFENDQVFILELGSANGTRINGVPVITGSAQRIHNGDVIDLGRLKIALRFG